MKGSHSTERLFENCFHDTYEGLHRYAHTILQDNEEARDIVQKVFIKLWEKKQTINFPGAARQYLYTAVHNLCLNVIRDKKTRSKYISHYHHTETGYVVESSAEKKELEKQIYAAIDSLPPRCREVFCKSRLEGKRYAEIAEDLQISVKTVEVQMGKALKLLRSLLADAITTILIIIMRLFV
jgi:RNA polymerase sigma-70 factor, Bacteroides expansion family 1